MRFSWGDLWTALFVLVVLNLVLGAITYAMNTNKGYRGGFQWGLFLGIFGIIAVACRPYEISYQCRMMAESLKISQPNMQSEIPQSSQAPQTSALSKLQSISSGTAATKRCDYCDAVMPANSSFCTKCGKSFKS